MSIERATHLWSIVKIGRATPDEVLDEIVATIDATPEPDFELIALAGAGPLESLFDDGYEDALWTRVETLARGNERFRRALSNVWAWDSAFFERREQLLRELGEHRQVTLRFVAEPRTFDDSDGFEWRAYEVEGISERPFLAALLRSIADQLDEPEVRRARPQPRRSTKLTRPPEDA